MSHFSVESKPPLKTTCVPCIYSDVENYLYKRNKIFATVMLWKLFCGLFISHVRQYTLAHCFICLQEGILCAGTGERSRRCVQHHAMYFSSGKRRPFLSHSQCVNTNIIGEVTIAAVYFLCIF